MSITILKIPGVLQAGESLGTAETLPSFTTGEGLHFLPTDWATPSTELWGTGNGAAAITGTPGASGLAVDATNKLVFPRTARTVFNVNSQMTTAVILKATAQQQQFIGSGTTSANGYTITGIASGAAAFRAISHDGSASAASDVTIPANMATLWTMVFGVFTLTTSQVAYFRSSTGLILGTQTTKASGAVGSNAIANQVGGASGFGTSAATVAAAAIWIDALTVPEMNEVCAEAVKLMASIGETL